MHHDQGYREGQKKEINTGIPSPKDVPFLRVQSKRKINRNKKEMKGGKKEEKQHQ